MDLEGYVANRSSTGLRARVLGVRDAARLPWRHLHPGQRAGRRQRRAPQPADALVRRARPCSSISRRVPVAETVNHEDFRYPVQYVLRPDLDYRGFSGTIASGVVRTGDTVHGAAVAARRTRVIGIDTGDGSIESAHAPMSVTLRLADEIDISRGDMLVHPEAAARGQPALRRDAGVDERAPARSSEELLAEAHHAHRARRGRAGRLHHRPRDAQAAARGAPRAERHRPRHAVVSPRSVLRSVQGEPRAPAPSS